MDKEEQRVKAPEIRKATFPQARRGYDRDAVNAFLDRVADWVESSAGAVTKSGPGAVKDELAKVGERTAGILTAAEDAAANLRAEAKDNADRLRAVAQEEARKARFSANQKADELVGAAEAKAESIIDDAIARRRNLDQSISSLLERRDEIAAEAQRLADELLEAVDALTSAEGHDEESVADLHEEDTAGSHEGGADQTEMLVAEPDHDERR